MITNLQYTNPNRTGSLLGVVAGQTQARDTHLPTVNHYFESLTASGSFVGNWYPTAGDSDTEVIITGGTINDGTTLHTVADATLSVHATSLNYIYLDCGLTATTVDGYVSGGTVNATPTIATSTSAASLTNSNTAGHILLCTWQAGALVDRYAYFAFACELLQKRSGSVGDVTFNWWSY